MIYNFLLQMDPALNNITPTSSMSNMEQFPPSTDPLPIQWPHEVSIRQFWQSHISSPRAGSLLSRKACNATALLARI
jgi:hypothetical protein